MLTIASMVEKEAVAPAERPLVAAVIYNRLHAADAARQIDATLRYGLHIPPTKSITESELASSSPYNTRKLRAAADADREPRARVDPAAAHPAKVDYLYYVRKPDKVHHFFTASAHAFEQYQCAHGYGC